MRNILVGVFAAEILKWFTHACEAYYCIQLPNRSREGSFLFSADKKIMQFSQKMSTCLHLCCELQHGIERAVELVENLRVEYFKAYKVFFVFVSVFALCSS